MATAARAIRRTRSKSKPRPKLPARARETRPPARRPASRKPPLPMPAALLDATTEPDVVEIPARTVLAIDGAGPPDGEAFRRSVGALYGAAYGVKFARKKGGGGEFKVGPLEGRWWAEGVSEDLEGPPPREAWRWRLRLAAPDGVRDAEVEAVVRAAVSRKGGKLEGSEEARRVRVERVAAARVGRVLHVGPYADEARSFARIAAALAAAGLRPARAHVEIYLSDPRRTAAARLRTVLLREIDA